MLAAGDVQSVAVGDEGGMWTWGFGPCLGHNDTQNRHVPMPLALEALGGAKPKIVAAGSGHTVAVLDDGSLWAWGMNTNGQLGVGLEAHMVRVPTRVGAEDEFGGSRVLTAACGVEHTLAVTEAGALWSCGSGATGKLGLNDMNNRRVPTRVDAQRFGNTKIVSAAAGSTHSAVVTEDGVLYTWGMGEEDGAPAGLGHDDMQTKLVPTPVATHLLESMRVGRCHSLPPPIALAFAMGTHDRLGIAAQTAAPAQDSSRTSQRQQGKAPAADDTNQGCAYVMMPGELVKRVVDTCASWPEGQSGELEGVVRLLGGGMVKDKVSQ